MRRTRDLRHLVATKEDGAEGRHGGPDRRVSGRPAATPPELDRTAAGREAPAGEAGLDGQADWREAPGRRGLRGHGPLLTLSWSHLLNDGASNYLPGVLPAVLVSLHDPLRLAGVLTAALIAGQALQPATGWLADRIGGRFLSPLGLLMSSLGGGLVGVAHSTSTLILLLLIGTGGAFFHPQALAGIRSMRAGKQGLRAAVFLVGGELGRGQHGLYGTHP